MIGLLPFSVVLQSLAVLTLLSTFEMLAHWFAISVLVIASLSSFWFLPDFDCSAYYVPFMSASVLSWAYVFALLGLIDYTLKVSVYSIFELALAAFLFHRASPYLDIHSCKLVLLLSLVAVISVSAYFTKLNCHNVVVFCGLVTLLHNARLHCRAFHVLPPSSSPSPVIPAVSYTVRRQSVFPV